MIMKRFYSGDSEISAKEFREQYLANSKVDVGYSGLPKDIANAMVEQDRVAHAKTMAVRLTNPHA